jgi:L-ascorbate metabolism protein UlaG (beta-lactamase superfamily)
MKITYIGHATLLIEIGGKRILTDPNFDPKLGRFLPRVSAPGIGVDELPKLDMILLTHAHADHLSFDSLRAIQDVPLYAPPPVARWIRQRGFRHTFDLEVGDELIVDDLSVKVARALHVGSRYGIDRWRQQTNMYLVANKDESVFFAGDTALSPSPASVVEEVLKRQQRVLDVALLPIGYAPWWRPGFRKGHLTSWDALTLFERLEARYFIPYHWGTFRHITSTPYSAIKELRQHILSHTRGSDVKVLEPGESFELSQGDEPVGTG